MKNVIVVAIDGPAGSGKSSVAKEVALEMGLKYIDSGALYRSITWFLLQKYEELQGDVDYSSHLKDFSVTQQFMGDGSAITSVNGQDVSTDIRSEDITRNIGVVSDDRNIRDYVNNLLRSWGREESILMDGRDIGTVVFPEAHLKIFLDASVEVRAGRRVKEYQEVGKNVDENAIKNQIIQRDTQDRSRSFGALQQAEDALYIDTSDMSKQDVIAYIEDLIQKKLHE